MLIAMQIDDTCNEYMVVVHGNDVQKCNKVNAADFDKLNPCQSIQVRACML